jgi:hypothetical protein
MSVSTFQWHMCPNVTIIADRDTMAIPPQHLADQRVAWIRRGVPPMAEGLPLLTASDHEKSAGSHPRNSRDGSPPLGAPGGGDGKSARPLLFRSGAVGHRPFPPDLPPVLGPEGGSLMRQPALRVLPPECAVAPSTDGARGSRVSSGPAPIPTVRGSGGGEGN